MSITSYSSNKGTEVLCTHVAQGPSAFFVCRRALHGDIANARWLARNGFFFIAIGILVSCTSQLAAAPIGINDFSGGETVVDFGNPSADIILNSPTTIGGVTFTANAGSFFANEASGSFSSLFVNVPGASLQGTLRDAANTSDFVVSFPTTAHRPLHRDLVATDSADCWATGFACQFRWT